MAGVGTGPAGMSWASIRRGAGSSVTNWRFETGSRAATSSRHSDEILRNARSKGRVADRGVRLIRGVDRHEGELFVPPSTAHGDAADGDRLEVRPETREPLGIRVTQNAGVVACQVGCRHFGNRKVRRADSALTAASARAACRSASSRAAAWFAEEVKRKVQPRAGPSSSSNELVTWMSWLRMAGSWPIPTKVPSSVMIPFMMPKLSNTRRSGADPSLTAAKNRLGERLRGKSLDAQAPAPAAGLARERRRHVGVWRVSGVGEPTFQIRIVVSVCACGVTTSSAANAVHANARNMRPPSCG